MCNISDVIPGLTNQPVSCRHVVDLRVDRISGSFDGTRSEGLAFILICTWAVVSAITVPVLAGLEIIACVFHLRRQQKQGEAKAALSVHVTALVVAIVAEIVFMSAKRSGA